MSIDLIREAPIFIFLLPFHFAVGETKTTTRKIKKKKNYFLTDDVPNWPLPTRCCFSCQSPDITGGRPSNSSSSFEIFWYLAPAAPGRYANAKRFRARDWSVQTLTRRKRTKLERVGWKVVGREEKGFRLITWTPPLSAAINSPFHLNLTFFFSYFIANVPAGMLLLSSF